MEIKRQSYILRSHLLEMAMLSQRAVDYSIKAHELGANEIYRLFWRHDQEWRNLRRRIGERGRSTFAADMTIDDCALRIYSALNVTYTAACEIAQTGSMMVEHKLTTPSPRLRDIARFTNGLVRLCTVALFKKEVEYARAILDDHLSWRWFETVLCQTRNVLTLSLGARAKFELAIINALGQIAEQSYEFAQVLAFSLDGNDCLSAAGKSFVSRHTLREGQRDHAA